MTLKFNPDKEIFDDQILNEFCLKNRILDYDSTFFSVGDDQYLSLLIKYERVADEKKRDKMNKSVKNEMELLDEKEKVLFDKMREIRNQKAREGGFPPYILATNNNTPDNSNNNLGFRLASTVNREYSNVQGYLNCASNRPGTLSCMWMTTSNIHIIPEFGIEREEVRDSFFNQDSILVLITRELQ